MGITQPVQVYLLRKWRPGHENIEVSDKSETSGKFLFCDIYKVIVL